MISAVRLDYFLFLAYSVIFSYVSFLMRLIEITKNTDFVVYSASSLWRCYNETSRRLHTLLWPQLLLLLLFPIPLL